MKFTFGKTPAAIKLEQLVQNNPSARAKITALLSEYTNQLLLITQIKEPKTVRQCMAMLRDFNLKRLDTKTGLTDDMRTYAKNVVTCRYRVFRHGFDDVVRIIQNRPKTS